MYTFILRKVGAPCTLNIENRNGPGLVRTGKSKEEVRDGINWEKQNVHQSRCSLLKIGSGINFEIFHPPSYAPGGVCR